MSINVKRRKQKLGLFYGLTAGLAFVIFAWGVDAFVLARSNSVYYWTKFIPGLIICVLPAGIVGWLAIRFEKHGTSVLLWGLLGVLFSWLVVWIPFTANPNIIKSVDPSLAQYFDFSQVKDLHLYRLVSLAVIGFASVLCGLLEINLILQATFASNGLSILTTLLVCIFLFGIAGSAIDQMINNNLREPLQEVNNLIQFAVDNKDVEVPRQTARKMHLSAVNQIDGIIQKDYQLTLVAFDEDLGVMDILVNFEGTLVKCTTIYTQPTDCIKLPQNP